MSEWISVEDRLPKDASKLDDNFVDVWVMGVREPDAEFFDGKFHLAEYDCDGDYSHHVEITPTHWMPLPEPPKEVE